MDPLSLSVNVAASGLNAQSHRLRVASENIANAQSTGDAPGSDPYQRKTITFASAVDSAPGATSNAAAMVRMRRVRSRVGR